MTQSPATLSMKPDAVRYVTRGGIGVTRTTEDLGHDPERRSETSSIEMA